MSSSIRLPGGNEVEVVGESFHRDALAALAGAESFGATLMWACLVPDPDNPYDRNAVKVVIDSKHVGHLSRDAAIAFRPVADRIRELGCEALCAAQIGGGGGKRLYGVVLDLGAPEQCLMSLGAELPKEVVGQFEPLADGER